jgi:transcriptional regulator with XRE-family HTH domain
MPKPSAKVTTSFGIWLDRAMIAQQIDQLATANRIGVAQSALSNWRRGIRTPKRADVERIAVALNANIADGLMAAGYLPDGEMTEELPIDEQRLIAFYRGAPDHTKKFLQDIAGTEEPGQMQKGEMEEAPDQ